jgi:hypothetical protein
VKENKCGYCSLRTAPDQASDQKRTLLPLFGEQIVMSLNLPKKLHNFFPPKGANRASGLWRSLGVRVQFGPSKSDPWDICLVIKFIKEFHE